MHTERNLCRANDCVGCEIRKRFYLFPIHILSLIFWWEQSIFFSAMKKWWIIFPIFPVDESKCKLSFVTIEYRYRYQICRHIKISYIIIIIIIHLWKALTRSFYLSVFGNIAIKGSFASIVIWVNWDRNWIQWKQRNVVNPHTNLTPHKNCIVIPHRIWSPNNECIIGVNHNDDDWREKKCIEEEMLHISHSTHSMTIVVCV